MSLSASKLVGAECFIISARVCSGGLSPKEMESELTIFITHRHHKRVSWLCMHMPGGNKGGCPSSSSS